MIDFSRRSLLKLLGAQAAAFLPVLNASRSYAAPATFPKRFIAMVWPNGVLGPHFWPSGGGSDFKLSEVLAPLEPYKKKINVLGKLELRNMREARPTHGGHTSQRFLLTGSGTGTGPNVNGAPRNVSVDQYVADALQKREPTPIHSLVLATQSNEDKPDAKYVSFKGGAAENWGAVTMEEDPYRLFNTIFQGRMVGTADSETFGRLLKGRKSLLDFAARDLTALGKRLGTEDRAKIEQHLASVREIERQMVALSGAGTNGCGAPDVGTKLDHMDPKLYDKVMELQMDLVVSAMACNLTRTATLHCSNGHNNRIGFFWLDLGDDFRNRPLSSDTGGAPTKYRHHHELAHNAGREPWRTWKNAADRWYFSEMARLLGRLDKIPEGGGTMLDNTVVLWANNMIDGGAHNVDGGGGLPWVMAGSCGGYFQTGRYVTQPAGTPHNRLLVSIANAMGVPTPWFGEQKFGGELPGLR